ncbi:MAG: iron ABC transporter permease [Pseudomonadota bacterium]|nr:iron ABC transporter permease [Gammaproteobacteria bacterium]MBU1558798.1 iron ABC transporter permease [Gammaproteobacteria bacterium]MBU1926846.1 iron ABC transporter permease [Gammaproteobacteria bacterium]MBU2546157.1 iron ABC transporter permease [Gammaproteobacteria bacterium]
MNRRTYFSSTTLLTFLCLLATISIFLSIREGSTHISFTHFINAIFNPQHSTDHIIIFDLRLPRTFVAFTTGGLLALAGALMQTLLRNPLADPYILGVSGGAAVATALGILLGLSTAFLNLTAFLGSLLSITLVMGISRSHKHLLPLRLLLTGVVVATGWAAIMSFILITSPDQNLRSILFWLIGDLSYAHFSIWEPIILLFGLVVSFILAKPLNILARGDLTARSLGINTHRLNLILFLLSSLLTALAVNMAGCIGFVGLIVPHMLRIVKNSDHRFVLPASVLLGGSLLTLADTLSRVLITPAQLPVGIVTAIIGVPTFIVVLQGCQER